MPPTSNTAESPPSPQDDFDLDKDDHGAAPEAAPVPPSPKGSDAASLPLLHGSTTLADALEEEENMITRLSYPSQRVDFFVWILEHREDFEAIVSYNLCLGADRACRLGEVAEWLHGSFNVCIPVYIDSCRKVMLRIPLPYKVGESTHPGNEDEKLRTEVATFIWLEENCPDVPIPFLWGFGFPGGQSFTRPENVPFVTRMIWYLQRAISTISSFFGSPLPCRFIGYKRQGVLEHGFLIMDHIESTDTKMLSSTWSKLSQDQGLRTNLMRSLSRIILSLSRIHLPRIGSWTIDNKGVLKLTNRPLMHVFHSLENEGIPTNISRGQTYTCTDVFYTDLLACHDSRIRFQPNSILNKKDGFGQMATLYMMRAHCSDFTSRDLRNGPFVLSLTDMHGSNLFVDSDWHIKCIVDLEWACSLPIEMVTPPYWMTSLGVDQLYGDELPKFEKAYNEFVDIFEEEERSLAFTPHGSPTYRAGIMRNGWKIGSFWYLNAIQTPKGLYNLFWNNMRPKFNPQRERLQGFSEYLSRYWAPGAHEVVASKLEALEKYKADLKELFEKAARERAMGEQSP